MLKIGIVPKQKENRYLISKKLLDHLKEKAVVLFLLNEEAFQECDGFILAGGQDIDPFRYQQSKHPHTIIEDPTIEELEFKVVEYAYHHHLPLLGICRGMQVMHVYFHGKLCQHVLHHQGSWHDVYYQNKKISVYSDHHQCLENCVRPFCIAALSEEGMIEGIQHEHFLGVQWHPELDDHDLVLKDFLDHVFTHKINHDEN